MATRPATAPEQMPMTVGLPRTAHSTSIHTRPAVAAYGGTSGLIEGNAGQVLNQCIGVGTVFVYDVIVTLIILKVLDLVIGLRVSVEVERDGLDLALHGETVQ